MLFILIKRRYDLEGTDNEGLSIGIIVLTWNEVHNTLSTLSAVFNSTQNSGSQAHIVLVDNGSDKKVIQSLEKAVQDLDFAVSVVKLPANIGFGAGMNRGIEFISKIVKCDYYWFLNNDAQPATECVKELISYARSNPRKKIIGSTLIDTASGNIECAGGCRYNSWFSMDHLFLEGQAIDIIEQDRNLNINFDYVYGAAILIKARFFHQIGGFNPRYFLYFEELEFSSFCDKDELGWCKKALVSHMGGATSGSTPVLAAFCVYHAALSSYRYTFHHHPLKLPTVIFARLVGKTLHGVLKRQPMSIKAPWVALWDFFTGQTKKTLEFFEN